MHKHAGILLVLCGPSGVGKSTISRRLAQQDLSISYIASATTRPKRPGEEDSGKKYEHLEQAEFFRRLDADEFLEYARNYDDYYGTPKHPCLDQLANGQDVLLEIDVQGALQVRYQYPKALLIFLLPPSEITLLQRLQDRARDTDAVIDRRFRAAKREIHMAKGSCAFNHYVTNDSLDHAVQEIQQILSDRRAQGATA